MDNAFSKPRLLVVDDEESLRSLCQRILETAHYEVETASNGEEALERCLAQTFDIVLTDLTMPGTVNGVQLVETLKQKTPRTDVIIMTAFPALESAIPTLKSGAYDYLIKPFDQEFLRSVIHRCVEKRRLNDELNTEKRLRQDLSAAYSQLQEMEQLKEGFLARINHELRIPLAPMLMSVELMAGSANDPQVLSLCEILRERLNQMRGLVESLLLFADVRRPEFETSVKSVDLRILLNQVVEHYRSAWESRNLAVTQDFGEGCGDVQANPELLETAFKNLMMNAIQFNRKSGTIQIQARRLASYVEISFTDTGIGIPGDKLSKVFDSFYQVASYLTREVGGFGLGLALVRRIMELHRGSIRVDSVEGKSTVFTVILPLQLAESRQRLPTSATAPPL